MKCAVIGFAAAALLVSGTAFANEELVKKNNCMICHKVEEKAMGPAFKEVAAKYKKDAEGAKKIEGVLKNGSKNAWGENSMMPPQPAVSEADAKAIATWMLSLAKEEAAPAAEAKAEAKPAEAKEKAKAAETHKAKPAHAKEKTAHTAKEKTAPAKEKAEEKPAEKK